MIACVDSRLIDRGEQWLEAQGADAVGGSTASFRALVGRELKQWTDLVKTIGLKAE